MPVSMNGEYLRVTAAELARAINDPAWALEFAEEVMEAEFDSAPPPSQARHLETHKAWSAIAFLLHRANFPVDIVFGEKTFTNEDWGYGPAKYLDPDQVKAAAQALARTSFDDLIDGLDPAELTAAEVYPLMWDEADALEWVRGWFEPLKPFFEATAKDNDAMLVWLD